MKGIIDITPRICVLMESVPAANKLAKELTDLHGKLKELDGTELHAALIGFLAQMGITDVGINNPEVAILGQGGPEQLTQEFVDFQVEKVHASTSAMVPQIPEELKQGITMAARSPLVQEIVNDAVHMPAREGAQFSLFTGLFLGFALFAPQKGAN